MLNRTSTAVRHVCALVAVMVVFGFALAPWAGTPARVSAEPLDSVVTDWNLHAVNTFLNPPAAATPGLGFAPQVAILHIAMVQGAIYDAVNMIEGGYEPYSANLPEADGDASQAAAVATAAHHVMVGVETTPELTSTIIDRLDTLLADSIAAATSADGSVAVAAGIDAGEAAATAMLAGRENDGRFVPTVLAIGTEPGEWRPTPPAFISDPNAWMGNVDPFMLESPSQFRSDGPLDLNSRQYTREYNEVKALGAIDSARTAAQQALADFFIVNPVEMYNRAFRTYASAEGLTTAEQARLFAMVNMAGADALINCSNDKVHFAFWRPITAIRLGDEDGNPATVGDPEWTSMVVSPPYSDHTSGYNCVTGGFMHAAEVFFGKGRADFSLVRIVPNVPNVTREYRHFRDVVDDTIEARIYQGLHFRAADVQGAQLGQDVAKWLEKNYFQPEKRGGRR